MSNFTRRRAAAGAPQRGLFLDGVWHCDCNPRQPANHFEVKKQGPNHGKWFRTCQKQQDDKSRCKFFLWDSDAHPREVSALANNARSEPANTAQSTPAKRRASPPPPYTTETVRCEPINKRSRSATMDSDYDHGYGGYDRVSRNELDPVIAEVETTKEPAGPSGFVTPSKRRTLPWDKDTSALSPDGGLQTPWTGRAVQADPFVSRHGKSPITPARPSDTVQQNVTPSSSPLETPTPHRSREAGGDDLVDEILTLLQDARVRLSTATETDLKDILSKHTKTAEGVRRGRDVTRSTIKARDAKIVELGYRISTLEAELEAEKAMVKHLQWQIQTE